jgi:predicted NACHT family NTPase
VKTLPNEDFFPILVRCRELDEHSVRGNLDDFLTYVLRKAEFYRRKAEDIKDLLLQKIAEGKALLILDGLDEIDDPLKRAGFCDQLETIALQHDRIAIIATSRIVGYREMGRRLGRTFEHMTLAELIPTEKDKFVREWCELIEHPDRRKTAAKELISDIHSTDRIERLTSNPMLLTAMALVKRKVGKLPSRRASLYRAAFEILLNWNPGEGGPLLSSA